MAKSPNTDFEEPSQAAAPAATATQDAQAHPMKESVVADEVVKSGGVENGNDVIEEQEEHDTPTVQGLVPFASSDDESDSSDDDVDAPSKKKSSASLEEIAARRQLWKKIEAVLGEYSLSPFAMVAARKWVNMMASGDPSLARVRGWLLARVNGRKRCPPISPWQKGCPELLPGLRATSFWDTSLECLNWVREIEAAYPVILEEMKSLREGKGFQPYRGPNWATGQKADDNLGTLSHSSGDWNVFYLFLHEVKFDENCARCPKTVEILERVLPHNYRHAFFSALTPGTHIDKHTGPTNKKLRCHLPLQGLEGAKLRVGGEVIENRAGKVHIMDDSYEHEAWHDGKETRLVLIFDIWHPDLSDGEVKFLSYLQRSKMREEKRQSCNDKSSDNFFSLLENTRDVLKDNSWWK